MSIPRMNYRQYRKARKLTHECCNYCDGNCLLLDDGEECVCVQSIARALTAHQTEHHLKLAARLEHSADCSQHEQAHAERCVYSDGERAFC